MKKWPALWYIADSCKEVIIAGCFILLPKAKTAFSCWGEEVLAKYFQWEAFWVPGPHMSYYVWMMKDVQEAPVDSSEPSSLL